MTRLQRMEQEYAELNERISRLIAFIQGEKFLQIHESERCRLRQQLHHMRRYRVILDKRIEFANG